MVFCYLISALIFVGPKPSDYPLHIHGSRTAIESFITALNQELGNSSTLRVSKIEAQKMNMELVLPEKVITLHSPPNRIGFFVL